MMPDRPTALTEEERLSIHPGWVAGHGLPGVDYLLAIIRRLDARVVELERILTEAGDLRKEAP